MQRTFNVPDRWSDLSSDPNAPAVLAWRRATIDQARSSVPVTDRTKYLCEVVRGKSVLDIGVVEHTPEAVEGSDWLHKHLRDCSSSCVGVDILADQVQALAAAGYEVVQVDITATPLERTFDVIVCGEVLEHVEAAGRLMQNCSLMLRPSGRLLVTVPNPWYVNVITKNVVRGPAFTDSADHVAWYDAGTLAELAERNGLRLDRFEGVASATAKTRLGKMAFQLSPLLVRLGFRPELFAKTINYEFVSGA